MELFAGDCPLEDVGTVLDAKQHYTVCHGGSRYHDLNGPDVVQTEICNGILRRYAWKQKVC